MSPSLVLSLSRRAGRRGGAVLPALAGLALLAAAGLPAPARAEEPLQLPLPIDPDDLPPKPPACPPEAVCEEAELLPAKIPPPAPAEPAEPPEPVPPQLPLIPSRPWVHCAGPYEGGPVPPGCKVVGKPSRPLWLTGSIVALASYGASSFAGVLGYLAELERGLLPLVVPLAGPFITMATAETTTDGLALLGVAGSLQAAGVGLALLSLVATRNVLVHDDEPAQDEQLEAELALTPWSLTVHF